MTSDTLTVHLPHEAIARSKSLFSLCQTQGRTSRCATDIRDADQMPQIFNASRAVRTISDRHPTSRCTPGHLIVAIAAFTVTPFALATFERCDRPNQLSDRINDLVGVAQEHGNQQNPDQGIGGIKRNLRRFDGGKWSRDRGNGLGFNRIHHCELPHVV